jgi:hypothetical protein
MPKGPTEIGEINNKHDLDIHKLVFSFISIFIVSAKTKTITKKPLFFINLSRVLNFEC